MVPKLYLENFMGEEIVSNTHMDDSVHRYDQKELRGLVSEYRSIASWIEQNAQTPPKYTPSRFRSNYLFELRAKEDERIRESGPSIPRRSSVFDGHKKDAQTSSSCIRPTIRRIDAIEPGYSEPDQ